MKQKHPTTTQFREVRTPSGKKALEAFCAVNTNAGNHVAICSPSLEKLQEAWQRLFATELDMEAAHHVWIIARIET